MSTLWFPLRRRLIVLVLGGVATAWMVMLAWGYIDTREEIDNLLDGQLVVEAHTLLALAAHEADEMAPFKDEYHYHDYQLLDSFRFQIWADGTRLVINSPGAPTVVLTNTDGFSSSVDANTQQRWRYYSQWSKNRTVRVIVGQNDQVREELINQALWQLLLPALIGLPLLGAWVWIAIRRGLRPLDVVAEQIAAREPDHLNAVDPETAPEEIRPLVESINHLFARVEQAIDNEKRFTADAAHELRTPLAALTAQAQVAMRARDADERRHAIDQLIASTRRGSRLVDQLLTLARVDPAEIERPCCVFLDRVAEEVCVQNGPMAVANNVTLELDAQPATIMGDADMAGILLRNLVDNAIRYTPTGGLVKVVVRGKTVTVSDTGPGIPVDQREQVFNRFHRLAGQEKEGSGLGLSIVARIAERHRAKVTLADGEGGVGLSVRVTFPA